MTVDQINNTFLKNVTCFELPEKIKSDVNIFQVLIAKKTLYDTYNKISYALNKQGSLEATSDLTRVTTTVGLYALDADDYSIYEIRP